MRIYQLKHKQHTLLFAFTTSMLWLLVTNNVLAHAMFTLGSPTPPRYNEDGIKTNAPCGSDSQYTSLRTNLKSIFQQGATVTVEWIETVNHPGFFIFDFAAANDSNFVAINTVPDDNSTRTLDIQFNYNTCTDCTLRMSQDMTNGLYYSCADIAIVDPADNTSPSDVTNVMPMPASNSVQLNWSNPSDIDLYRVLIFRSSAALSTTPANRMDYALGTSLGNGTLVYKGNANANTFTDAGLISETEYTYTFVALDRNYNYGNSIEQMATTTAASTGGSGNGSSGGTDTNNTTNSSSEDSGALFGLLFLLAGLISVKRLQRRV